MLQKLLTFPETEKMHLFVFHVANLDLKEWVQQQNCVKWAMN